MRREFGWKGEHHSEYLGLHGYNIKMGVHWIHRTLDRDRWGAVVNTVMNLRVP
jgi:hypothetical protein